MKGRKIEAAGEKPHRGKTTRTVVKKVVSTRTRTYRRCPQWDILHISPQTGAHDSKESPAAQRRVWVVTPHMTTTHGKTAHTHDEPESSENATAVTSRHHDHPPTLGVKSCVSKTDTERIRHEAIPHLRAKDGVLDSKASPSAPRRGKRGHPEVTITTGAKNDGHRVKVRVPQNDIAECRAVHTTRKSQQPHKGCGKRAPQMKEDNIGRGCHSP